MIKKITIQSFFSFKQHSAPIVLNSGSNLLVGINGTGKSNFLKAVKLLHEAVVGIGLEKLLNMWGGVLNIMNFGAHDIDEVVLTYEFDENALLNNNDENGFKENPIYEIRIKKQGNSSYTLQEVLKTSEFIFLHSDKGQGNVFKDNSLTPLSGEYIKEQELVLRQLGDFMTFLPLFIIKEAIEEIAVYDFFDTTSESPIRQLSPYYSDKKLLPNGENLTFLLNYLNGNSTSAYDRIVNLLKNANSQFRELVFPQPTPGKTLLALKEHNLERAVPIEHISDGTLRFLLLLSIFYNPNRGKVICIDEPEIGLHPDMIRTLAEGIKHAANDGTQMLIATHSPLLLNAFELEDLLIFEKDNNNSTIVVKKTEADFEDWEGDFLVGQMWLNGQIGGTRW